MSCIRCCNQWRIYGMGVQGYWILSRTKKKWDYLKRLKYLPKSIVITLDILDEHSKNKTIKFCSLKLNIIIC